jgi:hypothetical protein
MIHEACPSSGTEKKKHDETLVPNSGFNPDRRRGAPPFPSHHDPPTRLPPIDAIHGQLPSAAPPTAASSSRRPISDGVGARARARARASDTATQAAKGQRSFFLNAQQKAQSRAAPPVRPANPRCRSRKPGTPPVQPRQARHGAEAMAAFSLRSCLPIRPTIPGSIILVFDARLARVVLLSSNQSVYKKNVVSPMRLLGGVPRNWLGS